MTAGILVLKQPDWLAGWLSHRPLPSDDGGRLQEVLALTEETILRNSGGPFAAIVYDQRDGRRLGAAVNTVAANSAALAHAETQALSLAQQALEQFSLDYDGGPDAVLVTSSAPCTMCLGAIAWSGVHRVLFASTRQDVEAIGFDEGPATPRWRSELAKRDIIVSGPRMRRRGQQLLEEYVRHQGRVYNGRREK